DDQQSRVAIDLDLVHALTPLGIRREPVCRRGAYQVRFAGGARSFQLLRAGPRRSNVATLASRSGLPNGFSSPSQPEASRKLRASADRMSPVTKSSRPASPGWRSHT